MLTITPRFMPQAIPAAPTAPPAADAPPSQPTPPPKPTNTAPPASQPPVLPGGTSSPPPVPAGSTASSTNPSNPTPGKQVFLPTRTTTITRTWDAPVMHDEDLGRIPADFYQPAFNVGPWSNPGGIYYPIGLGGTFGMGQVDVIRSAPTLDATGKPEMFKQTQTLTATTYNQQNRTIGFGIAAALAGGGTAALVAASKGASFGPAGIVAGAVLGGLAGAVIGYKSAVGDKIYEQWMNDSINQPSLTGYTQNMWPDYRTDYTTEIFHNPETGRDEVRQVPHEVLQGWTVSYSPEILWKPVGSYSYPTLQHSGKIGPVGGAAMAIGAGAAIGAAAGFAALALV